MSQIKIGIIGGTGLDQDADVLLDKRTVPVPKTPFGEPSDSEVIEGKIANVTVYILGRHGKHHTVSPSNVNYRANIWAMKELGCTHLLVTTACGSLKEEIAPGQFAVLDQYIDRTSGKRQNSFYTVAHIGQAQPFNRRVQSIVEQSCKKLGYVCHTNETAVTIEGPRFSTLAESRLYQSWGAGIVNMTAVPEAQLAAEAGLIYASIALVTDYDVWRENEDEHVSVEVVMNRLKELGAKAKQVLVMAVTEIGAQDWKADIAKYKAAVEIAIMTP
ncbi:S-methyl-5'-thioadenosine phosphorylase [Halotydeus destructor]|nr:S-methyl-5'-thioadenosine phosphorylase [Halotydeus destructor]